MSGKDSSFLGTRSSAARQLRLPPGKIRSGAQSGALYAYPREKSIRHFMDQVRALTRRRVPLKTKELIEELNPVLRGGDITTSEPTSESSSTGSTAGSCDASGRIDVNAGGTAAGDSCRKPSCTASTGL